MYIIHPINGRKIKASGRAAKALLKQHERKEIKLSRKLLKVLRGGTTSGSTEMPPDCMGEICKASFDLYLKSKSLKEMTRNKLAIDNLIEANTICYSKIQELSKKEDTKVPDDFVYDFDFQGASKSMLTRRFQNALNRHVSKLLSGNHPNRLIDTTIASAQTVLLEYVINAMAYRGIIKDNDVTHIIDRGSLREFSDNEYELLFKKTSDSELLKKTLLDIRLCLGIDDTTPITPNISPFELVVKSSIFDEEIIGYKTIDEDYIIEAEGLVPTIYTDAGIQENNKAYVREMIVRLINMLI